MDYCNRGAGGGGGPGHRDRRCVRLQTQSKVSLSSSRSVRNSHTRLASSSQAYKSHNSAGFSDSWLRKEK